MSTEASTNPEANPEQADLTAADVAWDLDPLLDGTDIETLLDRADELGAQLANLRGTFYRVKPLTLSPAPLGKKAVVELLAKMQGEISQQVDSWRVQNRKQKSRG